MRDIITDNTLLLPALSRFGIPLGFGDSPVADVCHTHNVDCQTFLAVANFISGKPSEAFTISTASLTNYLRTGSRILPQLCAAGHQAQTHRGYKHRSAGRHELSAIKIL